MSHWQDSTVFITGGARGIGLGIARAFARAGARVAVADVDSAALTAAEAELSALTKAAAYELDVRDREGFARVADAVEKALGPVDVLVNNAGIAPIVDTSQMSYADWDWALGINLGGVVNGIQTFVPRMLARGQGGRILNTSSGAGLVGSRGAFYGTAKFAVVGLTESLRLDLEAAFIKVSVLCPGRVDTGIVTNTLERREAGEPTEATRAAAESATENLKTGVSIDSVGQRVLAGLEADQIWIHTDTELLPHLEERHAALVASVHASAAAGAPAGA